MSGTAIGPTHYVRILSAIQKHYVVDVVTNYGTLTDCLLRVCVPTQMTWIAFPPSDVLIIRSFCFVLFDFNSC